MPSSERTDAWKLILRNFSRAKFRLFVENEVLNPSRYDAKNIFPPEAFIGFPSIEASLEHWSEENLGYLDIYGTHLNGFQSYTHFRWVFVLEHIQDGLLASESIADTGLRRGVVNAERLLKDRRAVIDPSEQKQLDQHLFCTNSAVFMYYVTNAVFGTSTDLAELATAARAEFFRIHPDFRRDFEFGFGSPDTFLSKANRLRTIRGIQEIEARPDCLSLQFAHDTIQVVPTNTRAVHLYGQEEPGAAVLEQSLPLEKSAFNDALEEFQDLLAKQVTEHVLQRFFEKHEGIFAALGYVEMRPQVTLQDVSGKLLRPDFFLRPASGKLWDILDLKLPSVALLSGGKGREDFGYYVRRGIQQLYEYSRYFDSPYNRDRFKKMTGMDCFKPSLTLVIGTKASADEEALRRTIMENRAGVQIIQFDELLERARSTAERFLKLTNDLKQDTG